jgi:7-cyano-7-deazaguanosine (preQ0) biosynthesis protein QueE
MTLPISEVFGPTIQGEGPRAGRVCWFIRFGGCNLSCSWCDTPYTWDHKRFNMREEMALVTPYAIAAKIPDSAPEVVLTGGEPLIHQCKESWGRLLGDLVHRRIPIALETNGTISPNPVTARSIGHYSISPKLPNAGAHRGHQGAQMAPWPQELRQRSILKFVVENKEDVDLAITRADAMGWPRDRVWMMPEGTDPDILLKRWPEVVEAAIVKRVNVTQRLHVLAWGNERGH